jgi:drug/metabolite transporter (DMT)-like permease
VNLEARTFRTYQLLLITLLLRPFGNLSLAWGVKQSSQLLSIHPLLYLKAMLNPFVAVGISMLILALLTRLALLSVADLSFVLPLTALGYILSALLGKIFLNEQVSPNQWLGTALIFFGVMLVGSTPAKQQQ